MQKPLASFWAAVAGPPAADVPAAAPTAPVAGRVQVAPVADDSAKMPSGGDSGPHEAVTEGRQDPLRGRRSSRRAAVEAKVAIKRTAPKKRAPAKAGSKRGRGRRLPSGEYFKPGFAPKGQKKNHKLWQEDAVQGRLDPREVPFSAWLAKRLDARGTGNASSSNASSNASGRAALSDHETAAESASGADSSDDSLPPAKQPRLSIARGRAAAGKIAFEDVKSESQGKKSVPSCFVDEFISQLNDLPNSDDVADAICTLLGHQDLRPHIGSITDKALEQQCTLTVLQEFATRLGRRTTSASAGLV